MAQDWYSPAMAAGPTEGPSAERTAAREMRPLSTGELLDRTFSVYRSRFWLFAGLAAIGGAVQAVLNVVQLMVHHLVLLHYGFVIAKGEGQIAGPVILLLVLPVTVVVYAASVYALCEVYLGRPTSAGAALRSAARHWLRYVGIAVWLGWSAIWLFVVLIVPALVLTLVLRNHGLLWLAGLLFFLAFTGGVAYGVIAYIRNALAVPAAVMERTGVRASMRRSKVLAAGAKGRMFVVLLIAGALYMVAFTIDSPMLIAIARKPSAEHVTAQALVLLVGFAANTLVFPVALIGLSLVYFDQRVRREALDLLMMLAPETIGPEMAGAPEPSVSFAPQAPWPATETSGPGAGFADPLRNSLEPLRNSLEPTQNRLEPLPASFERRPNGREDDANGA